MGERGQDMPHSCPEAQGTVLPGQTLPPHHPTPLGHRRDGSYLQVEPWDQERHSVTFQFHVLIYRWAKGGPEKEKAFPSPSLPRLFSSLPQASWGTLSTSLGR